jgi:hypothetical protein
MRRIEAVFAAAAVGVVLARAAWAADPSVDDLVQRNFMVGKVRDSRSTVTMTLVSARGDRRVRTTVSQSKLLDNGIDQKRLVRFLTPTDVKGTATLLIEHHDGDDDIWIYLPALRKVRRLVANNKKDSFVGTDFSYGDIIGHRPDQWSHRLIGGETIEGVDTWVIESTPRSDAVAETSGYGKRKAWLRKDNLVAIRGEYWDQAGQPSKELVGTDVREIDPANGKWQAFRLVMRNLKTGHATELEFSDLTVGLGLGDELFTERYLEKEE